MGYVRIKEYKKQQQVKQHALNCSVNEDALNVVTYDLSILQYGTPVHTSEYLISANLGYFLINFDELVYCYCTDYLCLVDELNIHWGAVIPFLLETGGLTANGVFAGK